MSYLIPFFLSLHSPFSEFSICWDKIVSLLLLSSIITPSTSDPHPPTMGSSQSSKMHCNRYLDQQGPPSLEQQGRT